MSFETFNSSDAWLLEAIKLSEHENGAALVEIIFTADYINHAIMTFSEFDAATRKLINAGLIAEKGKRLHTTETFNDWWAIKFGNKKRVVVLKVMAEIEKYLNKTYSTLDSIPEEYITQFTADDFEKATADYLKLAQATQRGHQNNTGLFH